MPKLWALVDIDGTISDCSHRVSFALDARREKDPAKAGPLWDAFHAECPKDPPHPAELAILHAWLSAGHRVSFLSGRHATFKKETHVWLAEHGLPTAHVFLRGGSNFSGSLEYKAHMLNHFILPLIAKDGGTLSWIMEDQDRLVDMWRDLGYTCLQPRASAFGDYR